MAKPKAIPVDSTNVSARTKFGDLSVGRTYLITYSSGTKRKYIIENNEDLTYLLMIISLNTTFNNNKLLKITDITDFKLAKELYD